LATTICWSQQYTESEGVLVTVICWSQQYAGHNNILNVRVYWSQQYAGHNNILKVRVYWSQQYAGHNNTQRNNTVLNKCVPTKQYNDKSDVLIVRITLHDLLIPAGTDWLLIATAARWSAKQMYRHFKPDRQFVPSLSDCSPTPVTTPVSCPFKTFLAYPNILCHQQISFRKEGSLLCGGDGVENRGVR
jgi:hypothetical protein